MWRHDYSSFLYYRTPPWPYSVLLGARDGGAGRGAQCEIAEQPVGSL